MLKLAKLATTALFAFVAASSLLSLATAAPDKAPAVPQNCYKPFCLVSFF